MSSYISILTEIEKDIFKVGFYLSAGPYVTDDDVKYIVEKIEEAIIG